MDGWWVVGGEDLSPEVGVGWAGSCFGNCFPRILGPFRIGHFVLSIQFVRGGSIHCPSKPNTPSYSSDLPESYIRKYTLDTQMYSSAGAAASRRCYMTVLICQLYNLHDDYNDLNRVT